MIFVEPGESVEGPIAGWASWFRLSRAPEACVARETINGWYASFADRDSMVMSRLRREDDSEILQALDELYVHHLLSKSCQPRYEEDKTSPDFRLYRASEYLAGLEVLTLFPEQDFMAEVTRNGRLVDAINRRIRPVFWHAYITIKRWKSPPREAEVAAWLKVKIDSLPAPATELSYDDYPIAVYSDADVELKFTFKPRRHAAPPTKSERFVVAGPAVARFVKPAQRLRNALSRKGGSKYDHRDRPFAVVVSVRELSCDIEDVVNALYGDEVVKFELDNPGSTQLSRNRNGTFAISPGNPEGRNRRLSCVFALMRGWTPGSDGSPTVYRFDNPFAEKPFPDDLLVADHRMISQRQPNGVLMEWEQNTAP